MEQPKRMTGKEFHAWLLARIERNTDHIIRAKKYMWLAYQFPKKFKVRWWNWNGETNLQEWTIDRTCYGETKKYWSIIESSRPVRTPYLADM